MKITPVALLSLFALVSGSPAPVAEPADLEARQSFGSCRVTGTGTRLDVRHQGQLEDLFRGTCTLLTHQQRATEPANTTQEAPASASALLASARANPQMSNVAAA
ncbi:MAG: hypothetical protein Q9226_002836 [Calogaya cf. arnoldii]